LLPASQQVIVDVGGFLGIGKKPELMDVRAMKIGQAINSGELRTCVSMTAEEIEALPAGSI